jgi:hypothetical protein
MRSEFVLLLALVPSAFAQSDAKTKQRVKKMWADRCASCHTVPDPKIATDLAWLDQVERTT